MKVLLDENLPHDLLPFLSDHDVRTIDDMGWKSIKNGRLLQLIKSEAFDVFVTGDKNFSKQQNLKERPVALVVMSAVNWPMIEPFIPQICAAIGAAEPGNFRTLYCGKFVRKAGRKRDE